MAEGTKEVTEEVRRIAPQVDIYETKDNVILVADMPGVSKENLHLDVEKDELTISGMFPGHNGGGEKLVSELVYGEYRRTFTIGDTVDKEKISAKLEDGVLRLTLPKYEKVKPRKIAIEVE